MVTLLNIYPTPPPPCSNWSFYRQMFYLMRSEVEGILITGGDLNLRLNTLDSSAGVIQKIVISKKFTTLMSELGFIDVWREINTTSKDYTYMHFSPPHSI